MHRLQGIRIVVKGAGIINFHLTARNPLLKLLTEPGGRFALGHDIWCIGREPHVDGFGGIGRLSPKMHPEDQEQHGAQND